MPDGHCRHCHSNCDGDVQGQPRERDTKPHWNDLAQWWPGRCPACAEAERIEAALLDEYDEHEDIAVLAALRIVRGEA